MADLIRLTGVHPALDGDYDITEDFNKWELHCIKELTGLAGIKLVEAFPKGDPDVLVALGMVAIGRAGKIPNWETAPWTSEQVKFLWKQGDITAVKGEEGKESDPPSTTESANDSASGPNAEPESSGESSTPSSENPDEDPSPTGVPV